MKQIWKYLPILLAINNSCDCGAEENLSLSCPPVEECYIASWEENKESNIITGKSLEFHKVCHFGQTVCDPETLKITCEGVSYPSKEICDGIDNDCNGQVDDGEHLFVSKTNSQNPCKETELGVCKNSHALCSLGEWICIPPTDLYGQEICDGKDNDCDGEIDEDIQEDFIYTGPTETLNVGECRAGVQRCENGTMQSFGMVLPISEICGNGDDDDCDGLTDEIENVQESYDFALLLDISGSMSSYLHSLNVALCDWASTARFQDSRFAIVGIALNPNVQNENGIGVITDFTDPIQSCIILNNFLSTAPPSINNEYQLDAIIRSMTVGDSLELSWSNTRRKKIVMFTDEAPQWVDETGLNNHATTLENKILEIIESCTTTDTSISIFSPWGLVWNIIWDEIVSSCGGYLEFLVHSPQDMIQRLNYWFVDEC